MAYLVLGKVSLLEQEVKEVRIYVFRESDGMSRRSCNQEWSRHGLVLSVHGDLQVSLAN
jgi:hypothetical protein